MSLPTNKEKLFQLGLKALADNHINFAKLYFEQALLDGHELSVRYHFFLCRTEDKSLARDVILCAERKI
ncbi:MAG: hypothetical protein PVG30_02390 [Gammaproteobacteria bacterium]|jgi:hypothetical protein